MPLKNKEYFLFSLLFSIIISIKEDSMIVFPFKTIPIPTLANYQRDKNYDGINRTLIKNYNSSIFFDDHYIFRLLSPVKIGTPEQDIISFINTYHNNLLIGELYGIPNRIFPENFYKGYQYNKSSSFINNTSQNNNSISDEPNIFIGQENLYLFTKINDIKENKYTNFSNIKFKIENKVKYENNILFGLTIGLILDDKNYETNFMKQIHDRNIISSYLISFEYINENEGLLIIGKYPHQYLPEKYKEDQYKSFYSYQPKTMYLTNFDIEFDEIYSFVNNEKNVIQKRPKGNLFLNSALIVGTKEYMEFIIENFFDKYLNNNICEKNITNTAFYDFITFSCYDDKNTYINKFPNLYFGISSQNLTFEFTYKDLFKKINDKYYFLIIFEQNGEGAWRIGKPFYLKYTFVYNGDAKTIGFYQRKIENQKEEKGTDSDNNNFHFELNTLTIIIIIISLLVFIFLVIIIAYYFGKKCNISRKKHANELDDNFEYVSSFPSS